jgi:ArsR family transcriptional regulator
MTQDRLSRLVEEGDRDGCSEDPEERVEELRSVADEVLPEAAEDAGVLSALADETRCVLVHVLRSADGELCVCELEPVVDVSESAVSHALSDLAEAGLVERRKEGKWRYYRTTDRAEAVLDALDEFR